ncbi:MAG: hypothetical protein EBT92_10485 [Planctomycetes bacterium]|nr:hypothetical protein [Planctomycetota bacterium]NBY01426.1 hypothetical protein [Planctomycetota bacterium]
MKTCNRYAILAHDYPVEHFDFMLEKQGILESWRLNRLPGNAPFIAEKIPDHRLEYLEYEGPVSNDRGFVKRMDSGNYELIADTESFIIIQLFGGKYKGQINFDRMGSNTLLGTFLSDT